MDLDFEKRLTIRDVTPADNPYLTQIIRQVMTEFGINGPGSGFLDPQLDQIYETYSVAGAHFLTVLLDDAVAGGGGFGPLPGAENTAELQRMYFLPSLRGRGAGAIVLDTLLRYAREAGYKNCYLETMNGMDRAVKLYETFGFQKRSQPVGQSGHCRCNAFYFKELI